MKNTLRSPGKRMKFLSLLLIAIFASVPLQSVGAQGTPTDGLIPAGETIRGSVLLYAPQVKIEGTVDGDVFAISPDVVVLGEIKGDLFVLSRTARIDGILEGNLYTANSRITLGAAARLAHSVYAACLLMNMTQGSSVGNDFYLVALGGELSGSIGRDQHAYLGLLNILDLLFGESDLLRSIVPADVQLPPGESTDLLTGRVEPVLYKTPATHVLASASTPAHDVVRSVMRLSPMQDSRLDKWLSNQWQTFVPMLLIGLLLVWLFPHFLQGSTEHLRSRTGNSFISGIMIFFVCLGTALLASIVILALGLFFSTVKLPGVAWTIWITGFSGLSVALASFYIAMVYVSKVIVAYLLGMLVLGRLPAALWGRRIWILLLGELIVLLLLSIPMLGGVLAILTAILGLGTIYLYLRQNFRSSGARKQDLPVSAEGELMEQKEFLATGLELQPEKSAES